MQKREDDDNFDLSTSMEKLKNRSAPLLANLSKNNKDNTTEREKMINKDYLSLSEMKFPNYTENSKVKRIKNKYGINEYTKVYGNSLSSSHPYVRSDTVWDYVIN